MIRNFLNLILFIANIVVLFFVIKFILMDFETINLDNSSENKVVFSFNTSEFNIYLEDSGNNVMGENILIQNKENPNDYRITKINRLPLKKYWSFGEEIFNKNFRIIKSNVCKDIKLTYKLESNFSPKNNGLDLIENKLTNIEYIDYCANYGDINIKSEDFKELEKINSTYYSSKTCGGIYGDNLSSTIENVFLMLRSLKKYQNSLEKKYLDEFYYYYRDYISVNSRLIHPYISELIEIHKLLSMYSGESEVLSVLLEDIKQIEKIPQYFFGVEDIVKEIDENGLINITPSYYSITSISELIPRLAVSYQSASLFLKNDEYDYVSKFLLNYLNKNKQEYLTTELLEGVSYSECSINYLNTYFKKSNENKVLKHNQNDQNNYLCRYFDVVSTNNYCGLDIRSITNI